MAERGLRRISICSTGCLGPYRCLILLPACSNVKLYPAAAVPDGMLLLRIDAPIYFANVEGLCDCLLEKLRWRRLEGEAAGCPAQAVVLDMSPVTDVDATGIHFLHDFIDELRGQGVRFALANPSKQVLRALKRGGLTAKIGSDCLHVSMADAVATAQVTLCSGGSGFDPLDLY